MADKATVSNPTCRVHGCYLTQFPVRWPDRKRDNEHTIEVCLLCLRDLSKVDDSSLKDSD